MANWINIICVLMLCGYNETYSQMISGCDEFDACTSDLIDHLSSGNHVLCRKLMEYIPCVQGAQDRCPSLNTKTVEEMTAFASQTYDRICSELSTQGTKTWSNSRSPSVLERTTSSSLEQTSKTSTSSVDYVTMEDDTSDNTSSQLKTLSSCEEKKVKLLKRILSELRTSNTLQQSRLDLERGQFAYLKGN